MWWMRAATCFPYCRNLLHHGCSLLPVTFTWCIRLFNVHSPHRNRMVNIWPRIHVSAPFLVWQALAGRCLWYLEPCSVWTNPNVGVCCLAFRLLDNHHNVLWTAHIPTAAACLFHIWLIFSNVSFENTLRVTDSCPVGRFRCPERPCGVQHIWWIKTLWPSPRN